MSKSSELALVVKAAVLGSKDAFNKLASNYCPMLRRLFLNLTHDDEVAKDLTQNVLLKAWLNIGSFRAAANFSTWLYRIAYNSFYDYVKEKRECVRDEKEMSNLKDSAEHSIAVDFAMDFESALGELSESERVVALLFYLEDFAIGDISRITEMPIGTVKSHLHRARIKMTTFIKSN